jgi:putative Holliday junction resolvase
MRLIGIDYGERRIGVAAADERTNIAIPLETREVRDTPVDEIARIATEQEADELVIGLPLSMTGAIGPQAELVQEAVRVLAGRLAIPVRTWDERLTSAQAEREGKSRGSGARHRDSIAAAIMLQSYLDSRRR